ncbi:MAG: AAA family ATPase, partial [Saprospiraceae bacterium]
SNPGLKSRFKLHFEFADYLPQELSQIAAYACEEMGVMLTPTAKGRVDEVIVKAYRDRDRTFGNARFVHDLIEKSKIKLGLRIMSSPDPRSSEKEELMRIEVQDGATMEMKIKKELPSIPIDEELLRESLNELNHLIGMRKIKAQINELVRLVRFYRESDKDVLNSFFLHTVFIGNPGTGKTTVARILTKIYKALGVLERGHTVETDRQGLVAGFVGQTAIKTAEKIDEAMGGVLFIDEAYSLTQKATSQGDFGQEAVQTLLKRMEDSRGKFFVFVAGYPDNMESFLKANPGLNSRFDKVLKFEDYSPKDLNQIAMLMLDEKSIVPTPEAAEHLRRYFVYLHQYRDKYFGNARTVRNVVAEAIKYQNLRLAALNSEERLSTSVNVLTIEDVATLRTDKQDDPFNKKSIGFRKRATE